jgi:hypothetical protein
MSSKCFLVFVYDADAYDVTARSWGVYYVRTHCCSQGGTNAPFKEYMEYDWL